MHFSFTVPGKPVPKARPRMARGGFVFTPKKTQDYERLMAHHARLAIPTGWPTDGQYRVAIVVYLDSNVFGDLDNMVKNLDALNGLGVWSDDKWVCEISAKREFTHEAPHMEVTVTWEPRQVFQKTKRSRKVAK